VRLQAGERDVLCAEVGRHERALARAACDAQHAREVARRRGCAGGAEEREEAVGEERARVVERREERVQAFRRGCEAAGVSVAAAR
jgi:hypothetical protein